MDFRKAFDSVSHEILLKNLEYNFCIRGVLLDWIKDYLSGKMQFTVLNGVKSDMLPVTTGIPQGSVLGPILFTLFTNDLPAAITMGSLFMYADDTSIFCIGESADAAIASLNRALQEVYRWCLENRLTPHPAKSEVMLISTQAIIRPLPPIFLGKSVLSYVTKSRLLGMIVGDKLTWIPHMLELKKNFANKIDLLRRSRFLPKYVLLKFYFSVILPSVKYGIILWGSCTNSDLLCSIEKLHCRAAKIVYNLSKDTAFSEALNVSGWDTISLDYKFQLFKFLYRASKVSLPECLINNIFIRRECSYSLRDQEAIMIPRFNTR